MIGEKTADSLFPILLYYFKIIFKNPLTKLLLRCIISNVVTLYNTKAVKSARKDTKKMKKIISLALALIMLCAIAVSFTSCKTSDWEKIEKQGYFVCGITVYAPMNYFDETDTLVGFDTEFAKAVAAELGVEAKFQVIDWPNKYMELNSGAISKAKRRHS